MASASSIPTSASLRASLLALGVLALAALLLTLNPSALIAQDADDESSEDDSAADEREDEARRNVLTEDMDFSRVAPLIAEDLDMPVIWSASFQTRPLKFTGVLDSSHFDAQVGVLLRSAGHALVIHQGIAEVVSFEQARSLAPLVGVREIFKHKPYEMVRMVLTPRRGGADAVADLVESQLSDAGHVVYCGANGESLMVCDFVSSILAVRESVDAATPQFVTGSVSLDGCSVSGQRFEEIADDLYEIAGVSSAKEGGSFIYRVEESRAEEAKELLTQLVALLAEE